MKNQVMNGFDRMTISNLIMKANFINSEMTANAAYFPTPNPTLAVVRTSVSELQTAGLAAENRDRVAISYRNEKRDELVAVLHQLGLYVNLQANGNRTIAMSSGFDVAKEPTPAAPISFVDAPIVTLGNNPGELSAKVKKVAGARVYQYLITDDENLPLSQWTIVTSTLTKCEFKALQSAKRYFIRVAVVGVKNQWVYSEATSFVTQ